MKGARVRWRVLLIGASMLVAAVGVVAVVWLRLINAGHEPQGRNWWILTDTLLGVAYVPIGTALAVRGRVRLGVAFAVVGVCGLLSALAAEWHALSVSRNALPVVEHARVVQTVGLSVLVFAVPLLLPWPPRPTPPLRDRMTQWLALGVLAAWAGSLLALIKAVGDLPGAHVAGPLLLLATVPLIAVGAFVADIRDDQSALGAVSHRFLVWVILASGVVVLYTALVAGLGLALGANGPAWLLVG